MTEVVWSWYLCRPQLKESLFSIFRQNNCRPNLKVIWISHILWTLLNSSSLFLRNVINDNQTLKPLSICAVDELDSYMYQTVGHEAIDLYSEAMDLPLYRRTIQGSSLDISRSYRETEGDEVEDLYELLRLVKVERHSDGMLLTWECVCQTRGCCFKCGCCKHNLGVCLSTCSVEAGGAASNVDLKTCW